MAERKLQVRKQTDPKKWKVVVKRQMELPEPNMRAEEPLNESLGAFKDDQPS